MYLIETFISFSCTKAVHVPTLDYNLLSVREWHSEEHSLTGDKRGITLIWEGFQVPGEASRGRGLRSLIHERLEAYFCGCVIGLFPMSRLAISAVEPTHDSG